MKRALLLTVLAGLSGCTWPSDFDDFTFGEPRGVDDADGGHPGFVPGDGSKNPNLFEDSGTPMDDSDGGEPVVVQDASSSAERDAEALGDAGSTAPSDAGPIVVVDSGGGGNGPLGTHTGAELKPTPGYVLDADCQMLPLTGGTSFGLLDSDPSGVACPERLTVRESFTIMTLGYDHPTQNNGCEWVGPWGDYFDIDVDTQVYFSWRTNSRRIEVVHRGAICTYKQ